MQKWYRDQRIPFVFQRLNLNYTCIQIHKIISEKIQTHTKKAFKGHQLFNLMNFSMVIPQKQVFIKTSITLPGYSKTSVKFKLKCFKKKTTFNQKPQAQSSPLPQISSQLNLVIP